MVEIHHRNTKAVLVATLLLTTLMLGGYLSGFSNYGRLIRFKKHGCARLRDFDTQIIIYDRAMGISYHKGKKSYFLNKALEPIKHGDFNGKTGSGELRGKWFFYDGARIGKCFHRPCTITDYHRRCRYTSLDGLLYGKIVYWKKDGSISTVIFYAAGVRVAEFDESRDCANGQHVYFYYEEEPTGKKKKFFEEERKNGALEGKRIFYHFNGRKKNEATYKNGVEHGQEMQWYENGKPEWILKWKNGVLDYDESRFWLPDGTPRSSEEWKKERHKLWFRSLCG